MEPVVAHVNYQLQPVIVFNGENWAVFRAAFENYARQQGFFEMLGQDGADLEEPAENPNRWRQRMAQATTALTAGWLTEKMLALHRYSNIDNANTTWRRLCRTFANTIVPIRDSFICDLKSKDAFKDQKIS